MPVVLPLAAALAALSWAVWTGFGAAVTGRPTPEGPLETPRWAAPPLLGAFLAGFGLAGASLHAFGRVSPGHEAALAVATGILFAVFVRSAVAMAAADRRG